MAGNQMPQIKGEGDPLGHQMGQILKDSYVTTPTKGEPEALDLKSAGLNGYGDFVLIGHGAQVVRVPDEERVKLAAYLLAPILDTEPAFLPKATERMALNRAQKDVPPQFRVEPKPEGQKKQPRRTGGGIIARK